MSDGTGAALATMWAALGGAATAPAALTIAGAGELPSVFAVSDLAGASVGAACLAVAELLGTRHGTTPAAVVDRRLAGLWFATSIRPQGWQTPPTWDAVAGDYRTADGWIRLHTNAPHHRQAALAVLEAPAERAAVARAVAGWAADALEDAVVAQGGCAAAMRDMAAWARHPQGRAVSREPLVIREAGGSGPPPGWAVPPGRPLRGVRVLDMTRVLAGPVATRFLAGFGAEVLRIDPPDWDEPAIVPDVTPGKLCARLDLRRPKDRARWEALLRGADILVHGYRPGALDGLGLGAARRGELNPGLIDISLDAYGWSGPWQRRRGFDSLVQMSSGIAAAGMAPLERDRLERDRLERDRLGSDRPTPLPVQALDHATGYLLAAAAVRGLTGRLTTGAGGAARLSLARIAALLVGLPAAPAAPCAAETPADLADGIEATPWGPARRLRPPCGVAGAVLHWERPAAALGSDQAAWLG